MKDDLNARTPWPRLALTVMPAAMLMHLDKQVMVVLAPSLQKEFNLDLVTITHILAAMAFSYAVFQIPGAWLAARLGSLLTIALCVCGWSLAVFMTSFAVGALSLLVFRALMGALEAPNWLASVSLLEKNVSVQLRSRASAALLAAAYLGKFISGPVVAAIGSRSGWRACFHIFGTIGLVFGSGLLLYSVRSKRIHMPSAREQQRSGMELIGTLKQPSSQFLALTYLFFSGVQSFVYVLLPLYLEDDRHTSLLNTGWLSSAPFVALYCGVITSGFLSDAVYKRTKSLIVARLPIGAGAMVGSGACFAFALSMHSTEQMIELVCVGMALVGIGEVALWSAVQDATSSSNGSLTAWVQVLGAIGLGLAPLFAAHMIARSGAWNGVRYLLLMLGVAAAVTLWSATMRKPIVTSTNSIVS